MAKQDKSLVNNLGNSWYVGINAYYTPQKLMVFPATVAGTTVAGNMSKQTTSTVTTKPKTTVTTTATKPLGENTYAQINAAKNTGAKTGSTVSAATTTIKTGGTTAGDATKTINTVGSAQTKAGGTSGGVLNQETPLYRVPEARNADAALAAAVKAGNIGKETVKPKAAGGKNGALSQVEASILAADPGYAQVAAALGVNPKEYLGRFSGAENETEGVNAAGTNLSLGDIWVNAYGAPGAQYANQSGLDAKTLDYLKRSGKQALLGNYSDDVTALGTGVQVLAGILGLDTAADVRDLYYDITHWEGSKAHVIQTLLDVVGLVPVVGAVKYADEVGTLVSKG